MALSLAVAVRVRGQLYGAKRPDKLTSRTGLTTRGRRWGMRKAHSQGCWPAIEIGALSAVGNSVPDAATLGALA
jgi:hypothetical protein